MPPSRLPSARRRVSCSFLAIGVALICAATAPSVAGAADPALKAAYGFDETSGTQLPDVTGNGNNGTLTGPAWTTSGRFGSALTFDGVDDLVTVPDADMLDFSTAMTIEMWVRPTQLGGWRAALIKEAAPSLVYAMYPETSRAQPWYQIQMEGRLRAFQGTAQLPVNTWTHLAGTYDGAVFRLYVNGTQVASEGRRGLVTVSSGPLRIGGTILSSEWFKGQIDEVRLYNRGLTAAEIQADMNAPVGGAVDNSPPTAPTNFVETGDSATTISTSWTASTDDRGVQGYHLFVGGTEVGSTTSTSFTFTNLACSTTYQLGVEARDARPNVSPRTLLTATTAACDTTQPNVALTAPAAGAQVSGTVSVNADASDNDAVAGVQFLLDDQPLGSEDTSSPYSVAWNTRATTNGDHVLKARARDRSGNTRTTTGVTVTVQNTTAPPPSGLVAGYGFDEGSGASVADASGRGNHGAITGAAWTDGGRFGKGLAFDGIDDQVNVPDADSLDLTDGMTLSAWVRPTTLNGAWRTVIFKHRTGGLVYGLYAQDRDPRPLGEMYINGGSASLGGPGQLPLGDWTHLAYTYDGAMQRLYVDGVDVANAPRSGPITTSTGTLSIGRNTQWGEAFAGVIDEVRVYNRALPQAEIQADMNTSVSEPDGQAPSTPTGLAATGSVGRVALTWNASTDNVGVTHYNVHRGTTAGFTPDSGNRIGQPTTTSHTDSGLPAGTYYYKVTASDRAGNTSLPTSGVSGTALPDTEPPSVSVTAPANGATVSGTVNVAANASDNDSVAGVQFMVDGQPLGSEDTSSPYEVAWNSRLASNAAHTITARARDATGNIRTSAGVGVTVDNTSAPPPGLVAGYGFDFGSGSSVADASGNGNVGTIRGATWVPVGRIGGALSFDGIDDWVTVPDANSLDLTTGMTVSAWMRPNTTAGWRSLVFKERTGNFVYGIYANANNVSAPNGEATIGGTVRVVNGTAKAPDRTWTHVALTYDGTAMRLYVGGSQVSILNTPGAIDTSTGVLRIGGNQTWGEFFEGLIDEVRVYNRPLSASEIQTDMVTGVAPDTTAPTVASKAPDAEATGVTVGRSVTVTFSEPMDASTITSSTFALRDPSNTVVPATVSYDADTAKATLRPTSALRYGTRYTATLEGGSSPSRVKDIAGNTLASDHSWSFTTEPTPPPVVVLTSPARPFSSYVEEIMRAEGLNGFTTADVSLVDAAFLANFDVAVLGDVPITAAQATAFANWVNAGGNLLALSPDPQLAGLLGLTSSGTTLSNAYLRVDTSSGPGAGIVGETIQYHGTADRYTLNGATAVATLHTNATTATTSPAVSLRSVGASGGQAAAFTFDLATSTSLTRQGNPAWAGSERDGFAPIRTNDLFYGGTQPNWVDLGKIHIPQADELQRLFANLITFMNRDRTPVPRFWYLPRGEKAAVIMTGDDHAQGGTAGRFNQYKAASAPSCSVQNWDCVRATSYVYPGSPLTNSQAAAYEAEGFEVALHPSDGGCDDFTLAGFDEIYDEDLALFAGSYPSVPTPTTSRFHCVSWSDWDSHAKVQIDHGIRLDTNYYHFPPSWATFPGFMTGSGMLMKFADAAGNTLDLYQADTHITDEWTDRDDASLSGAAINSLLNRAIGADGYYGLFTANMHTDDADSPGSDAIVASAKARDVPIISARQALRWTDGRNGSRFKDFSWSAGNLSFTVTSGTGATGLQGMLPVQSSAGTLTSLTRGGSPVTLTSQTVKGIQYAFFTAADGQYVAHYG